MDPLVEYSIANHIVGYFYDADVYCPHCFPEGVDHNSEEVIAIFSWENDTSVCCVCFEPLLER
jgi:hypothetical protein